MDSNTVHTGTTAAPQRIAITQSRTARSTTLSRPLIAVVIAGAVCRVAQYAANRSYWGDEAALVLNIRGLSARELLGPLKLDQAAPLLFLQAEHGVYRLLGGSELSLRLMPFVLGMAALFLFAMLARRTLELPWAVFAVTLFAFSDRLIFHAVEAKPYGTDMFTAVLLTWIALGPVAGISARQRLGWLSLASTIAVWFSYPAALIFGGLSLGLLLEILNEASASDGRHLNRQELIRAGSSYVLLNIPVAVSFLQVLRFAVGAQQNDALTGYWQDGFIDLHRPWIWPVWLVRRLLSLCNYPSQPTGVVILIAMLTGLFVLATRRQWPRLLLLTGPLAVALLAAAAQRYPFDGARLTVFLTPSVLLLTALGFEHLFEAGGARWLQWLTAAGVAFVLAVAVGSAGYHLFAPRMRGHLRPIAAYVAEHARGGDVLYCPDYREFACYWRGPVRPSFERSDQMPPRFWIIWAFASQSGEKRVEPILAWARSFATQRDKKIGIGGAACLFEQTGSSPPQPQDAPIIGTMTHQRLHAQPPDAEINPQ